MGKKKGNNYIIDEENGIAKIELNRQKGENLWAIIDLEDLDRVLNIPYTWFAKYDEDIDSFYAVTSWYYPELKRSKPVHLHQFIMNANGKVVDHENHNTLDDRKSNLRVIADSNNSKNRKTRNKNNKSGYRNVSWDVISGLCSYKLIRKMLHWQDLLTKIWIKQVRLRKK